METHHHLLQTLRISMKVREFLESKQWLQSIRDVLQSLCLVFRLWPVFKDREFSCLSSSNHLMVKQLFRSRSLVITCRVPQGYGSRPGHVPQHLTGFETRRARVCERQAVRGYSCGQVNGIDFIREGRKRSSCWNQRGLDRSPAACPGNWEHFCCLCDAEAGENRGCTATRGLRWDWVRLRSQAGLDRTSIRLAYCQK